MHLSRLRAVLPQARFLTEQDVLLQGLQDDSRRVRPGDLFCAVPGSVQDGVAFVPEAVRRGAAAVLTDGEPPERAARARQAAGETPLVLVPQVREAVGRLAHAWWGEPTRRLQVVGVTGTNGKTTTAKILQHLLAAGGHRAAYLGTVGYEVAGRLFPARTTTPGALDLARLARLAVEGGETALVLEASSHGLAQQRLAGVRLAGAVFTNLSRDHLDYHGTLAEYFAAKLRLLEHLPPGAPVVARADDPWGRRVLAAARSAGLRPVPVGRGGVCEATAVRLSLRGVRFRLRCGETVCPVALPLPGRFNVQNALLAAAAAWALGIPPAVCARALAQVPPVPGRMEQFSHPAGATVIVDYAHTHAGLREVLQTLRALRPAAGRLTVVFGCGGDRDRGRRPRMGRVAARYADRIILTNDNPRSEPPEQILEDILRGVPAEADVTVEPDRRRAIRLAVAQAHAGDVVLIAGKGHETWQEFREVTVPLDDRVEVRRALARIRAARAPTP